MPAIRVPLSEKIKKTVTSAEKQVKNRQMTLYLIKTFRFFE